MEEPLSHFCRVLMVENYLCNNSGLKVASHKHLFKKINYISQTNEMLNKKYSYIKEHWKKYPCSVISEGSRLISSKIFNGKKFTHSTNGFEKAVTMLNQVTRNNIIFDMVQIETEAYNNRIQSFERRGMFLRFL